MTSQVSVVASAAQVQTTTGEVANEVSGTQAATLPLNGRNYQSLPAALMPGVTNLSPDTALGQGGFLTSSVMSVNGMGLSGTQFYLDGIWNMNSGDMDQTTITPNPDTIEEVRVLQNNYSVQYTLTGANTVLLETKSGTSTFHGSAFEYLRNDALNARNFFSPTVPALKQNIFGYTLGGPLYIPGHYNTNKQRTFFFWSQQWVDQHTASTVRGADPTSAMRTGDFSALCTSGFTAGICNTASQQLTNPATGLPYLNNNIASTSTLNPNSLALLNALAPPPNNGTGFLNYINLTPTINTQRDDEIKVDHNFSSKLRLMAEYLDERQWNRNSYDNFLGSPYTTHTDPIQTQNQLAQIQLTATLSPSMVNTASISMNNLVINLELAGTYLVSQVPGFQETLPYAGAIGSNRLPQITFSGGYAPLGIDDSLPIPHASDLEDTFSDNWSWLRGKHYLQAGVTLLWGTKRQRNNQPTDGAWSFTGQFTGNPIADYLIGDAATFVQNNEAPEMYIHYVIDSPYIQDQWKATRRLTLTGGLRWIWEPLSDGQPAFKSMFDPAFYTPSEAPIVNPDGTITPTPGYNPLNGVIINGVNGIPDNFSTAHEYYWSPSFGFAWDVFGNGKTSLRGGYGVNYQNTFHADCSGGCNVNPPFARNLTLIAPSFPNPIGALATPPSAPTFGAGDDLKGLQAPPIQNYSLSLEHQFASDWLVSIAGAGNIGHHFSQTYNINQPLPDAPYDYNPIINSGTVFPYLYSPYQGYGAIDWYTANGNTYWNALEISLRHPVGHNLFLNVSYTWQHGLSDTRGTVLYGEEGGPQDVYHPRNDYGSSNVNTPQILSFSYIWNLPWYRHVRGLKGTALGGWKYSGVTTIQSGFSLDPGLSIAFQGLATRSDRVSGQSIQGPKTVAEWFNTAAFEAPQPGYFGNAGPGTILGPGVVNFDMAFYKDFRIKERHTIEFRAELFNIFNIANFSGVSTAFGSGNYGQVTSALDPRIAEFALRYQF